MRSYKRRGANAVEFALITPVLLYVLFGTMEYSWFFLNQILLDAAASEGARTAAVTHPDFDAGALGVTAAEDYWDLMNLPIEPIFSTSSTTSADNDLITITGELTYDGLFGGFVKTPASINVNVTTRIEQ